MNRERITITIKKDILSKVDKKIDGVRLRNRSHAIESLLSNALNIDLISDAIVMAGGDDAIKSISAIKESLIQLKRLGLTEVIVAVGFLGDKIKKELADGKSFGLNISYLESGDGSGGVLTHLKNALKKTFIVVNVSEKIALDMKTLLDFHRSSNFYATVATNDIKTFKGVYVLEPDILTYLPKGFSMLEEDLFPKLLKERKLSIYPIIST